MKKCEKKLQYLQKCEKFCDTRYPIYRIPKNARNARNLLHFLIFCEKYSPHLKNARNFAIQEMAFIAINHSARKVREMREI